MLSLCAEQNSVLCLHCPLPSLSFAFTEDTEKWYVYVVCSPRNTSYLLIWNVAEPEVPDILHTKQHRSPASAAV